jgi:hypothetical protein
MVLVAARTRPGCFDGKQSRREAEAIPENMRRTQGLWTAGVRIVKRNETILGEEKLGE